MLISMAVWIQVSEKPTAPKSLITFLNFEAFKMFLRLLEDWLTDTNFQKAPQGALSSPSFSSLTMRFYYLRCKGNSVSSPCMQYWSGDWIMEFTPYPEFLFVA